MYFIPLRWNSPCPLERVLQTCVFWGDNWCFSLASSFHANSKYKLFTKKHKCVFPHGNNNGWLFSSCPNSLAAKSSFRSFSQKQTCIHCPEKHETHPRPRIFKIIAGFRNLPTFKNWTKIVTTKKRKLAKIPLFRSKMEPVQNKSRSFFRSGNLKSLPNSLQNLTYDADFNQSWNIWLCITVFQNLTFALVCEIAGFWHKNILAISLDFWTQWFARITRRYQETLTSTFLATLERWRSAISSFLDATTSLAMARRIAMVVVLQEEGRRSMRHWKALTSFLATSGKKWCVASEISFYKFTWANLNRYQFNVQWYLKTELCPNDEKTSVCFWFRLMADVATGTLREWLCLTVCRTWLLAMISTRVWKTWVCTWQFSKLDFWWEF